MNAPKELSPIVVDVLDAAARLRANAGSNAIPLAVADYLDAIGQHWRSWLPWEPSRIDKATVLIVRAVLAAYPPDASSDAARPSSRAAAKSSESNGKRMPNPAK